MRTDKSEALKLRLKGNSYGEITKLLGVPKSTLSVWFKNQVLSSRAQGRIQHRQQTKSIKALLKRNRLQTVLAAQRAKVIRTQACSEITNLSDRELMLVGTALYWGEGYKRPITHNGKSRSYHPVSLSNADPKLVVIFVQFLHRVCNVPPEKIIAEIRIYKHHNESSLLKFWTDITKIPIENFRKSYYGISKSSQGKRPYNILPYGTIQIRVYDTKLYHRIMGWIEGLSKVY